MFALRAAAGGVTRGSGSRYLLGRRLLSSSSPRWADAAAQPVEEEKPPSEKIGKILEEILALNMLEVKELTTHLKTKLGVDDIPMGMGMPMMAAPVAAPAAGADAGAEAAEAESAEPEKTIFAVKLVAYDQTKKIALIKEVRSVTSLGLKEAKALVDEAPSMLMEGVPKAEAEDLKRKLEEIGGTIALE